MLVKVINDYVMLQISTMFPLNFIKYKTHGNIFLKKEITGLNEIHILIEVPIFGMMRCFEESNKVTN